MRSCSLSDMIQYSSKRLVNKIFLHLQITNRFGFWCQLATSISSNLCFLFYKPTLTLLNHSAKPRELVYGRSHWGANLFPVICQMRSLAADRSNRPTLNFLQLYSKSSVVFSNRKTKALLLFLVK